MGASLLNSKTAKTATVSANADETVDSVAQCFAEKNQQLRAHEPDDRCAWRRGQAQGLFEELHRGVRQSRLALALSTSGRKVPTEENYEVHRCNEKNYRKPSQTRSFTSS